LIGIKRAEAYKIAGLDALNKMAAT